MCSLARHDYPRPRCSSRHRCHLLPLHFPPAAEDARPILGLLAAECRGPSDGDIEGEHGAAVGAHWRDGGHAFGDGGGFEGIDGGHAVSRCDDDGVERCELYLHERCGEDTFAGREHAEVTGCSHPPSVLDSMYH